VVTVGDFGVCSKTCGGGIKERTVTCDPSVSQSDCNYWMVPKTEVCNTEVCRNIMLFYQLQ
jgi:hypothetical protein